MKRTSLILIATGLALALSATSGMAMNTPTYPSHDEPSKSEDNPCHDELGFLHVVRIEQVRAVEDETVHIRPVCESTDDVGSLFIDGNVGGLRKTIWQNETMLTALTDDNYKAEDVVGIRFGKNSVILYVHKR
jgi:hypothetical protein